MAAWDKWEPELAVVAHQAPVPLMYQCLNRAARSFFRQTRAWQEWLDPECVMGSAFYEYWFDMPQDAELLRLERATLNGRPLGIAGARDLRADPSRHARQGCAYLVSSNLRDFIVGALPADGEVQAYVSLIPSLDAKGIPDELAALHHEAIREGAKAELLNTPDVNFYKPDQAAIAMALFQQAIADCAVDVWRSNTSSGPRGRVRWC